MNLKEFQELQQSIIRILKKKYTNLSVGEATTLANEIINETIKVLNLEQQ